MTAIPEGSTKVPIDLDALDRERLRRGWRKLDLAAAAGITQATMSAVYKTSTCTPNLLRQLARALQAEEPLTDTLLGLSSEPSGAFNLGSSARVAQERPPRELSPA